MASDAANPAAPAPSHFHPISLGRMSAEIVDQIRQLILAGTLVPGTRLPAERDLCTQFGVSRVTVREALRVLESNGLVEIRVGARGGAFVTAPTSDRVGAGLIDLLALSGLSPEDVTEARQVIDLGTVGLVCERATDEDIASLFALCDAAASAAPNSEEALELSAAFHVRMAESTHNGAIAMLVASLREPMLMSLRKAREVAPASGTQGIAEHRAIVEAIRDRDADRARRVMSEHLSRTLARVSGAT